MVNRSHNPSGRRKILMLGLPVFRTIRLAGSIAVGVFLCWSTPASARTVTFDFNTDQYGNPIVAGQRVDDQYSDVYGLTIGGYQFAEPAVYFVIAQDSSTTSEGDQVTPGYGPGNTASHGNLLIAPRNTVDENGDFVIDFPDTHPARPGGFFYFSFRERQDSGSVTIVDADESETGGYVRAFEEFSEWGREWGVERAHYPIPALGDNSVQTIEIDVPYDVLWVQLGGSGGIAQLTSTVPTPSALFGGLALMGCLAMRRRHTLEDV